MHSERRFSGLRSVTLLALLALAGCYEGDPSGFRDSVVVGRDNITAITVSGDVPVIEVGATLALTATGTTDGDPVAITREVTWSSSNPAAVSVDGSGRITGTGNGSADITATLAQFSDTVTVTASDAALTAITVSGPAGIDECGTGDYTASGLYEDASNRDITSLVSWSVTDSAVGRMSTLSSDRNRLISRTAGGVGVVASRSGIDSPAFAVTVADNLTALAVTPETPSQLKGGDTLTFTATGTWGATSAVISRAATWSVANDDPDNDIGSVANGDGNPGRFTADEGGTGAVTAACGGLSDSVDVTVVFLESLEITNEEPIELAPGGSVLLVLRGTYSDGSTRSLGESATWTLDMISGTTLTVSNSTGTRGRITAGNGEGTATVTAEVDGLEVEVTVSAVDN